MPNNCVADVRSGHDQYGGGGVMEVVDVGVVVLVVAVDDNDEVDACVAFFSVRESEISRVEFGTMVVSSFLDCSVGAICCCLQFCMIFCDFIPRMVAATTVLMAVAVAAPATP